MHSKSSQSPISTKVEPDDWVGKDMWNMWVLSLEWKTKGLIDSDSEDRDCDVCKMRSSIPT